MNVEWASLPPYADVVFRDDLHVTLPLSTIGVLCWMIRNARPTGDGAWVVAQTQEHIGTALRIGRKSAGKELALLDAAGLITIAPQRHFGKGKGSASRVYYLTYHPALGSPVPPSGKPPGQRPLTLVTDHGLAPNGTVHDRPAQYGAVHGEAVDDGAFQPAPWSVNSAHAPALHPVDGAHRTPQHMSVLSSEETSTSHTGSGPDAATVPFSEVPTEVQQALRDIGWNPQVPVPAKEGWWPVLRAIGYAKEQPSIHDKAAFVNARSRDAGGLTGFLTSRGCWSGPAADRTPTRPRMDPVAFDQACETFPAWAAEVTAEAKRRALAAGRPYVSPSLTWEVAAEIPLPDTTSGTGSA